MEIGKIGKGNANVSSLLIKHTGSAFNVCEMNKCQNSETIKPLLRAHGHTTLQGKSVLWPLASLAALGSWHQWIACKDK